MKVVSLLQRCWSYLGFLSSVSTTSLWQNKSRGIPSVSWSPLTLWSAFKPSCLALSLFLLGCDLWGWIDCPLLCNLSLSAMPPHSPSNPFLYLSLPCRSALCPEASRPSHCRLQHPKFLQQQQQLPLLSQPYLIPGNPQCRALHQLVSLMDGRACCLSHWPPAALPLCSQQGASREGVAQITSSQGTCFCGWPTARWWWCWNLSMPASFSSSSVCPAFFFVLPLSSSLLLFGFFPPPPRVCCVPVGGWDMEGGGGGGHAWRFSIRDHL